MLIKDKSDIKSLENKKMMNEYNSFSKKVEFDNAF
jgi:hypothetical protein